MDMLLRHLAIGELADMLERHADCSSAPQLVHPGARERARRTAKQNGLWKRLGRELDPTREIPVLKRSIYRQVKRNGNRTRHQQIENARSHELELATLALWLDHPKADLDYLQDLLWAYCDDLTWVMAAHEFTAVDLGSAAHGARFAEILFTFEGVIEPEVAERVHREIEERIFRNVADYRNTEFWHTAPMNWNHVCNGSVIRAALLEMQDTRMLARFIHPLIQNMTYALDGFTDDGGCEEGAGYWGYGFGHFVQVAYALHCRTAGELNLMSDEKVERICRFPLAAHIDGPFRATFGDCDQGAVHALNALQVNRFHSVPELYELCIRRDSGEPKGTGPLRIEDMHSLALYSGERATGKLDQRDYALTDLGMVKMRGVPGPHQMTVVAVAGHNGAPHNHNDIGSFMVFADGRMALTDPGGPLYNKETFENRRYEILWCRSKGHSVPIINGREQKAGAQYRGKLSVEGLNGKSVKRAVIDMARAYPRGTVSKLVRTLELAPATNTLTIEDAYQFRRPPETLEEAFVTFEKVSVNKRRDAVRIGPVRGGVTLTAAQTGVFNVAAVTEKPEHTKPGTSPLQRITFVPATLTTDLVLRFVVAPC